MLYFFRLLLLLITTNQTTIQCYFDTEDLTNKYCFNQSDLSTVTIENVKLEFSRIIETVFSTLKIILNQGSFGLTLANIETFLFVIVFIRFAILATRYDLRISFCITCISIFAGWLWYRHLLDLLDMYRTILMNFSFFNKLAMDAIQLRSITYQVVFTDMKLGNNVHWYNPILLIYYSFINGIVDIDLETGLRYYIDPISMFISNLKEPEKSQILPFYYKLYNKIIPQVFDAVAKFWNQLSGIAAYAVITRIGKRYCPYLVRWHWTFLLIIGFVEQILIYFCYRISYFQSNVLIPRMEFDSSYIDQDFGISLGIQVNFLNGVLAFLICSHFGLIFFGLFHAIIGQYFYFPFLVENVELHIGPRPKNSIYSGGNTSWQDEKEQNVQRVFPKLWYGLFGAGTTNNINFLTLFKDLIRNTVIRIRKLFRNSTKNNF